MKSNNAIYERYRKACDTFFNKKSEYFKSSFDELKSNLEAKEKLVEQAEALKDSEDWKETTEKLVELQKQWKTIGPVPHKDSEVQWRRFTAACDAFFDRKKNTQNEKKKAEIENLAEEEIHHRANRVLRGRERRQSLVGKGKGAHGRVQLDRPRSFQRKGSPA